MGLKPAGGGNVLDVQPIPFGVLVLLLGYYYIWQRLL
jgi:hypothetical protein